MEEEKNEQGQEEPKKYPVAEKQAFGAGTPFQVLLPNPKELWITNYAYYLKQKSENGPLKPLLGRKTTAGKFEVYIDGAWQEKNLWEDFAQEVIENGEIVLNAKGKPKKRLLFDQKFEYLLKFETPIDIEYWNSELKQRVVEQHQVVWLRTSKSLSEKIKEEIEDKRTTKDSFFLINYDSSKAPADQYKVKFDHD